ncbi:MAG TPA: thioredoxin [Methanoculleus sp.]|nr:thioredoxin [Methanoculleus sp.]
MSDGTHDEELEQLREKRRRQLEALMGKGEEATGVVEVTDLNFSDVIRENDNLLVDCWAEWCGPCRMVGPVIDELAVEFAGIVTVAKCDADANPALMQSYQISAIPTLLFFRNGQMVGRLTGAYPKEVIRKHLVSAFDLLP